MVIGLPVSKYTYNKMYTLCIIGKIKVVLKTVPKEIIINLVHENYLGFKNIHQIIIMDEFH